ncbi:MAG TPA: hypothetical protein VJN18_10130 [Polyangiaceae bacterium]|nr:hypothetical protein [Polyangiaceae bacterium]
MVRVILLSLALGVISGCGSATPLTAETPKVHHLARRVVGGSVELQLLDVTDQRTCSKSPKFNDLCIAGLRSALDAGLRSLLRQFVDPQRPGEKYTASFQLLELAQEPVFIGEGDFEHPKIVLRWRLELKNAAGDRLLLLKDSTDEAFDDVRKARAALRDVLEDTMNRIGEGLNDADWKTSRPHPVGDRSIRPSISHEPVDPLQRRDAGAPSAPGTAEAAVPDGG